jgi:hypothetical protein
MGLFDWFGGHRRLTITHRNSDNVDVHGIADDINFIRKGSGLTTVTGSVGYKVKLDISEQGSVIIRGNIGSKCQILKDGDGTLTIDGDVARDLKLTIYGQGKVYFSRQPNEDVIRSIQRESVIAQIYCAGVLLPPQNPSYARHNMGRSEPSASPSETRVVVRNVLVPPSSSSSQQAPVEDKYTEYTQIYIESHANQETIADRIKKLGKLNREEEQLLEGFMDPLMFDYFDDVPVGYREQYYNLSSLLQTGMDPMSRGPLKLSDIQPARKLLENFESVISKILSARAEHKEEEQSNLSPSM